MKAGRNVSAGAGAPIPQTAEALADALHQRLGEASDKLNEVYALNSLTLWIARARGFIDAIVPLIRRNAEWAQAARDEGIPLNVASWSHKEGSGLDWFLCYVERAIGEAQAAADGEDVQS